MSSEFSENQDQKRPSQDPPALVHVRGLAEQNGWILEQYGESVEGVPLLAWVPKTKEPIGIFFAAIHGEEAQTLILAHQLMREVTASQAHSILIPVFNPDGVLHGTRQNARGVDLNRNFPSVTWRSDPSPTFPPFTLTREAHDRNQISSPGTAPASEPEVSCFVDLVNSVKPDFLLGLHAPDECVLAPDEDDYAFAQWLAENSGLEVVHAIPIAGTSVPDPGSSNYWAKENTMRSVSYEIEIGNLPQIWHRHRASLIRSITEIFDQP